MELRLPLQVYLDSSDFSVLSDPRRLDASTTRLRDLLLEYSGTSLVQFRFSIVHVSEVAPVTDDVQEAAERRAAFIFKLCGSNALVTTQEIQEAELQQVSGFSPLSNGRWYPALEDLLPESLMSEFKSMVTEELRAKGMTRAERRQKQREIFKLSRLTQTARHAVAESLSTSGSNFLSQLPFESHELGAVKSYFSGGPGRAAASTACHRVLANPIWIMAALATQSEGMKSLTDWIRLGGSSFVSDLSDGIEKAREFSLMRIQQESTLRASLLNINALDQGVDIDEQLLRHKQSVDNLIKRTTAEREHKLLLSLLERYGNADEYKLFTVDQLRAVFPGLATAVAAGVHVFNKALETPHKDTLIPSDFGDVMHAFYAPYVDIYRTDRFMADGLKKSLRLTKTLVSPKLSDLPALIKRCLLNRSGH